MMGLSDATKWYTQQSGDPSTGFVSGGDAISSVTQIYTDMAAPGSVTDAMLAVPKVDQSVVGNLLTANVATGTDTLGDTTGFTAVLGSIVSSTDYARRGTRSVKLTGTSGTAGRVEARGVAVQAGETYTFTISAYGASMTTPHVGVPRVYWVNSGGSAISSIDGASVTLSAAWTDMQVTGVAPAGAVTVNIMFWRTSGGATGDVTYFDSWGFWQGAGGLWAPPGTPIANLGTYTDESVGRRIFTWDAVNSRWQMTYGDTGWREILTVDSSGNVTQGSFASGFWGAVSGAAGFFRVRRTTQSVHFWAHNLQSLLSNNGNVTTVTALPGGFRYSGNNNHNMGTPVVLAAGSGVSTTYVPGIVSSANTPSSFGVGVNSAASPRLASLQLTIPTNEAWPTSLPGTASGSIPS